MLIFPTVTKGKAAAVGIVHWLRHPTDAIPKRRPVPLEMLVENSPTAEQD